MSSDKQAPAVPNDAATFRIQNMDCAAEESEIRRALEPIGGIESLSFQLGARTLSIRAREPALAAALAAIRGAGFDPQPIARPESKTAPQADEHDQPAGNDGLVRMVVALGLAIAAECAGLLLDPSTTTTALEMALAVAAIALAGLETYRKGLAALRRGKLTITTLMSIAVTGAFLIGQWPEAAMVMALFAIAELIEARALDRARNAIRGLMALAPEQADVKQPDGSWRSVPAAEIPLAAIVRIRPGERVPLDGEIERGTSAIDQAPVTGESMPVDKTVGDAVFAGTINQSGELQIRVTAAANDTTLARIIHAVEQAEGSRAPTQRFVDRFAAIYTPAVFGVAVLVAVATPPLFGWGWLAALYKALVLLVIACPCALVISTPVTVVSALASAARRGILIKGGVYLEQARMLKLVALDKTGTITEGRPRLVETEVLSRSITAEEIGRWAGDLAAHSDHPVSKAIAEALGHGQCGLSDFTALPGRGIQARIDGRMLVLGNHRLIEERGLCSAAIEARLAAHEAQGRTTTLLASDTEALAIYAVADTIKPHSREAIASLHRLGVTSLMLSGDNATTARAIAAQAGIDDVRGDLLPEDKLTAIEDLRTKHPLTAMVGDGINDAPALARADIGIAMGTAGTDTAMEAADIVIMNDDLRRIPETIRLSRRTNTVLKQNITLALGIKGVFLLLALFGNATMWMAVFADMGTSLLVVANGLRLLSRTDKANPNAE